MAHVIKSIEPDSIAEQLTLKSGDELVSIGGEEIIDWIDYQSLCCREEMELTIIRNGEWLEFTFEKDEYEPLGLVFDSQLMSPIRNCVNKCVFCFVDQLPKEVRPSLNVKDDDWRLSLMMGNFVTLTNVSDKEMERIIRRHAAPLYISVHATDGALRAKMLGTPRGAHIMRQLTQLAKARLSFHAQAVLCHGMNDGVALDQTIGDLLSLYPAAQSLALVPVGLTQHRDGLPKITPFDADSARAVIRQAEVWQKRCMRKIGTPFVHIADEFYLLAGEDFPSDETYEGYPQIENGVGLLRLLWTEYEDAWRDARLGDAVPKRVAIATGTSAAPFLRKMLARYPVPKVDVEVYALENGFFGDSVTTAGLLTGMDIIRNMQNVQADKILMTEYMLRDGEDVFLDGVTLEQVKDAFTVPVEIVGRGGEDLLRALMDE